MIRIEVRDTGPGVPEAKRCAVFGDFVQLARDERAGGTGLGLAIAAGIAAQMEGTIGCTDNPASSTGPGAIFWVELPLQPAHLPLAGALRPRRCRPGRSRSWWRMTCRPTWRSPGRCSNRRAMP
ncbi:ATP-binding protein [Paeniroseomonas aquatica]|uniref:ATP-binding protein n=1 Tax=Paeniroseomonas aquatica TaxID=373043 RepID=UPI003623968F